MPCGGFESREPGVVGALFDHSTVRASLIADGFHCDPVAIRMAHRLMKDRLFLISDATFANPGNPAGPRASLDFEDFIIRYESVELGYGRYTNQEGKLAGSAITLLDAVRVCVDKARIPLMDTLRMASTIPAEIIGMGKELGKNSAGLRGQSGAARRQSEHQGRVGGLATLVAHHRQRFLY